MQIGKLRILSVVEFLTGLCLRCFLRVRSRFRSTISLDLAFLDSIASWLIFLGGRDLYDVIQVSFHTFHYKG